MTNFTKGIITVTSLAVGFAGIAMTSWMGWVSLKIIGHSETLASQQQWQEDYGKKIDWLVEHNGANPTAISKYYHSVSEKND